MYHKGDDSRIPSFVVLIRLVESCIDLKVKRVLSTCRLGTTGERYGAEAMSASGTLWDIIRDSGTGAGDAVREVSEVGFCAQLVGNP